MFKKVLLLVVLLFSSLPTVFADSAAVDSALPELNDSIILGVNSSKVYVNGKLSRIDAQDKEIAPFIENGTTFVPLRFLSNQLAANLSLDPKIQEITIKVNNDTAKLRLGDPTLYINDKKITMNSTSKTVKGTTYLPLKNIVEDLFHKKLYYKNGIIIISDEVKTISSTTLAELEKLLKPHVVFSGAYEFLYIYSDGSSAKKKVDYGDETVEIMARVQYATDQYFYVEDTSFSYTMIHKVKWDGTEVKSYKVDDKLGFVFAQDGYMYFNTKNDIVKISEEDASIQTVIGKGGLLEDNTKINKDKLWFTDFSGDSAIYTLNNGKNIKLSNNNSYLKYVVNNWIYYTYYENNRWNIYRITTGGGQKTKLSSDADVGNMFISNNKIYYLDNHSKTLREMNLDGSNKRVLSKLVKNGLEIFDVSSGNIYFSEEDQQSKNWNQSLYRVNISTGAKQLLINTKLEFSGTWQRIENVKSIGDFVSYSISNQVYVVKNDGSNHKKVDTLWLSRSSDLGVIKVD